MTVLYFGCHKSAGHWWWLPGMRRAREWQTQGQPWERVDAALCPPGPTTQGIAALHHLEGWTALAFWDSSVDQRPGSNSVFFVEGTLDYPQMVALAREQFPEVWERFGFTVRRAVSARLVDQTP